MFIPESGMFAYWQDKFWRNTFTSSEEIHFFFQESTDKFAAQSFEVSLSKNASKKIDIRISHRFFVSKAGNSSLLLRIICEYYHHRKRSQIFKVDELQFLGLIEACLDAAVLVTSGKILWTRSFSRFKQNWSALTGARSQDLTLTKRML